MKPVLCSQTSRVARPHAAITGFRGRRQAVITNSLVKRPEDGLQSGVTIPKLAPRTSLRLGLPSMGRMAEDTMALLKGSALSVYKPNPRQYVATIPQRSTRGGRPDVSNSPFSDLGLEEFEEVPAVRVRQHVNPLRREFQIPHEPLAWHEVFADPTKPLLVDIGCGSGRFLLKYQKLLGHEQNALGIEIRRALVRRANTWAELLQLKTCIHYVFANATVSLSSLLSTYPGPITTVTIQMPDPQFKKRHKKRRVVQPQLVKDIARMLAPGGRVFLQSDVEEVAVDMRNLFEQHASDVLNPAEEHSSGLVFFSDEVFIPRGPPAKKVAADVPANDLSSAGHGDTGRSLGNSEGNSEGNTQTVSEGGLGYQSGVPTSSLLEGDNVPVDHQTATNSYCSEEVKPSTSGYQLHGVVDSTAESGSDVPSDAATVAVRNQYGDVTSEVGEGTTHSDSSGDTDSEADDSEEIDFRSEWRKQGWLLVNPMGIPTEREHFALSEGGQVYRVLLKKMSKSGQC